MFLHLVASLRQPALIESRGQVLECFSMPFTYSNREYADMVFVYGFCNGSANAARAEYQRKYPNRRCPSVRVFYSVFQHLHDNGTFPGIRGTAERVVDRRGDREARVIVEAVQQSPGISVRRVSLRLGVPKMRTWRKLKNEGMHPYHIQKVQHLQEDHERRVQFCSWLEDNVQLWDNILWTDEATFTRAGLFNVHNEHWWAKENPHKTSESNFQQRFSVNVWCGMVGGHLIGPHIFQGALTGQMYADFLVNELPLLLEDVPLNTRRQLIFQHNGAPPHYSRQARQCLDEIFP